MESISGKARRHLKALGHHLQPVVLVGKEGVSDALVVAIKRALTDHELIKVKLGESVDGERREIAATLADASKSELVAVTGRTLLLYKRNPQKAKIELPDSVASKAAAKKAAKKAKKDGAVSAAAKPMTPSGKAAGKTKKPAPVAQAASDESDASLDDVSDEDHDDDGDFGDDD